jgi:hypothetical protein
MLKDFPGEYCGALMLEVSSGRGRGSVSEFVTDAHDALCSQIIRAAISR